MAEKIASLIVDLEEEKTVAAVRRALDEGVEPLALVEELREGMSEVGRRFEEKEYYLSELIMSAEIFKQAIELIEVKLGGATEASKGSVVVGTVNGDIHDIGKNIVASLLRCDGFDVHDLGVDVSPGAFVSKLQETGAKLLALSGLLTMAFDAMKETIEAVSNAALHDSVKIIIGGGPVNESVVEFTGAHAYGKDAGEAVRLASKFLG